MFMTTLTLKNIYFFLVDELLHRTISKQINNKTRQPLQSVKTIKIEALVVFQPLKKKVFMKPPIKHFVYWREVETTKDDTSVVFLASALAPQLPQTTTTVYKFKRHVNATQPTDAPQMANCLNLV